MTTYLLERLKYKIVTILSAEEQLDFTYIVEREMSLTLWKESLAVSLSIF